MLQYVLGSAALALIFGLILTYDIKRRPSGTKDMREISEAIRQGSMAYLKRQYKTISIIGIILAAVLFVLLGWQTALGFLLGLLGSALAGFIGMNVSVASNVRVTAAAHEGLDAALKVAFRGGAVTGFVVVGLALLGVGLLFLAFGDPIQLIGFGFGASLMSLFARVGGGIYTKAADVGADLVGKVEKGIPEDDPRNPAVIADNVGDNVGDCAGMAADLFETYAVTTIAAMLLGALLLGSYVAVIYPLLIGAVAILASILGSFFVRLGRSKNIMGALYKGIIASSIFALIGIFAINTALQANIALFIPSVVGILVTLSIVFATDYWTSTKYKPVWMIAEASQTGAATNIITGMAVGLKSTWFTVGVICVGVLLSYMFGGIYGIAIAAVAMLSMTGIIVAVDSYGPITDNAGGIAEMSNQPKNVRAVTDLLDAVGNTTKAVTKGFAIGSAALATLTLLAAFTGEVQREFANRGVESEFVLSINDPLVLIGLFIGGMLPFLFSGLLMQAVGRAAFGVVNEVRRQFREIKGIMRRKAKPDYAKCVDIVTVAAQRELLVPGLLAVLSPVVVGLLFGVKAVGGMLAGSIISGMLLALFLSTSGAAWDNAKKYIEAGNLGGKGSDSHKAAVVGDTVGDPCKDSAAVSLNPLVKVISIVSILFVAIFLSYSLL